MDGRRGLMMARRSASGPQVANVGDIAYKAPNGKIMVVSPDAWSSALGTPVGVVVIPSGFAPDNGLARIVSLYYVGAGGVSSDIGVGLKWALSNIDTPATNYTYVASTDNLSNYNDGVVWTAHLPSDNFDGSQSYVDPMAKYVSGYPVEYLSPSPYLGDAPNPQYYYQEPDWDNGYGDFNGKGNSDSFGSGNNYQAASAAKNYKVEGAEEIEWYLPAMGELGYLVVRFKKIAEALAILGAGYLDDNYYHWSFTETASNEARCVVLYNGQVHHMKKTNNFLVRPFAQLDF